MKEYLLISSKSTEYQLSIDTNIHVPYYLNIWNIDYVSFFISFCLLLAGARISFTLKGSTLKKISIEYRYVAYSLMAILFLDLISYYLYLIMPDAYPHWYIVTHTNIFNSAAIILSWRIPFLTASILSISQKANIKKLLNMSCIVLLILAPMLLIYDKELLIIKHIRELLPTLSIILSLFLSGLYSLVFTIKNKLKRVPSMVYSLILFIMFISVIENFVISLIDDLIIYAYSIMLFCLFFIVLFIKEFKKGKLKNET